jgi:hypothetical protein
MDVQGYEKEIIQGMRRTLQAHPTLFIEVHPFLMTPDELRTMFRTIKESGYTKAVVMKTRKSSWMKKDGTVRPTLAYLTRAMGFDAHIVGMGTIEHMSLSDLQKTLPRRKSGVIVFLS